VLAFRFILLSSTRRKTGFSAAVGDVSAALGGGWLGGASLGSVEGAGSLDIGRKGRPIVLTASVLEEGKLVSSGILGGDGSGIATDGGDVSFIVMPAGSECASLRRDKALTMVSASFLGPTLFMIKSVSARMRNY
jgi:hypothetical protein